MPMLILCREKLAVRAGHVRDRGISFSNSLTGAVPRITHAGSAVIHTPDKSGFPFASRGAGAARSTSPFAVRGARGLGYLNHCAAGDPDAAAMKTIASPTVARLRQCGHFRRSSCMSDLFIIGPLGTANEGGALANARSARRRHAGSCVILANTAGTLARLCIDDCDTGHRSTRCAGSGAISKLWRIRF
jgi:hypothetical protein